MLRSIVRVASVCPNTVRVSALHANRRVVPQAALARLPASRLAAPARAARAFTSNIVEGEAVSSSRVFVEESAKPAGPAEQHEFQAETKKLLHIVASALYTNQEVFIRELVSNAADALEKLRHAQLAGEKVQDDYLDLEIHLSTDEKDNTLTIQDFGSGMLKEELIRNLGSIGHSGSLDFMKRLSTSAPDAEATSNIIGQFGVGFYSCFMVANRVKVYSRSYKEGAPGYLWTSDGNGSYEICEVDNVPRGTKIVLELKEDCQQYSRKQAVEEVIKKYSNFVSFKLVLNGEQLNTIKALWTMNAREVTEDENKEFYQFISKSYDRPTYSFHYQTDSPLHIRALFYVGQQHPEKFGMGRMDHGINLFSRKVLIQPKSSGLLPDWLRFIKGVVDSEDVPLNISRENLQDSQLLKRLNSTLTKRILRFFADEMKRDLIKYDRFYEEFGSFLKEGICTDFKWKQDLGKLLRMESSFTKEGTLTSIDEYVARMPAGQDQIYFLVVPTRQLATSSPYYEGFKSSGTEVLFLFTSLDEFVMSNLAEHEGKRLVSIESAQAPPSEKKEEEIQDAESQGDSLSESEVLELSEWLKNSLVGRVSKVKTSTRLVSTPAIIVDHESASFRRMMKFVDPQRAPQLPKQQLEINPKHPVIILLNRVRTANPEVAVTVAEQLLDNALIAAGLLDDPRPMLPRLAVLMESTLKAQL